MRKRTKILLLVVLGGLGAIVLLGLGAYRAARHVPDFYEQALVTDEQAQGKASDELLQNAAALASDTHKSGKWQALFTAEQVNGWLAVDFVKNYPDQLPPEIGDPRVAIAPHEMTLACRYDQDGYDVILSLTCDVYVEQPNVVAVRIRRARVGALPVALGTVLDAISKAARNLELPLKWRQADGDPVALFDLQSLDEEDQGRLILETLELREGEVYVAGTTKPK